MKVNGKDAIYYPYASDSDALKARGASGIPFLAPWANRLDEHAFYANGKKYVLNLELGNIRLDSDHPIHGFLTGTSEWKVTEAKADDRAAWVTSRLEFYRQPDWMAQWPFAHIIEMTYRLQNGVLEIATALNNLSAEPMPVSIGFHSFFQVTDATRENWTFGVGARTRWVLTKENVPTGEKQPIEKFLPKPQGASLKGLGLDDVFSDLIRDASGRAVMWLKGKSEKVEVIFGPNYRAVVVYTPDDPKRSFICFEPMAAITDAMNLAHKGLYQELQYVPPGQTWRESFWVRPSGF
jgi:aldose 1-epimerase